MGTVPVHDTQKYTKSTLVKRQLTFEREKICQDFLCLFSVAKMFIPYPALRLLASRNIKKQLSIASPHLFFSLCNVKVISQMAATNCFIRTISHSSVSQYLHNIFYTTSFTLTTPWETILGNCHRMRKAVQTRSRFN